MAEITSRSDVRATPAVADDRDGPRSSSPCSSPGPWSFVGSQQTQLPPPFGVARNGLITYAKNGDIYTVDPRTGDTAIVIGPENEIDPEFSLDGTRLMFSRQRGDANTYDQVVSNADGPPPAWSRTNH